MEDGEKVKSKNNKRKDIRTKAFEETKLLNFYNLGGIRFNNIATNDAMVKSNDRRGLGINFCNRRC